MDMNIHRQKTLNTPVLFQAVLLMCGLFLAGCKSRDLPVGPPLERVTKWDANPQYTYDAETAILQWLESDSKMLFEFCHTPESRWDNGLAACMSPFMVNWEASDLSSPDHKFVIVHGVQVGGNPILGTSRHATIRIPVHGIERVEFVIVRYHLKGPARLSGHVQLRFVFKEDSRPQLFDKQGNPDPAQPYLDDLIISWEAWRPTNTSWKFIAGLDPEQYTLTPRMFSGNQRFLNDSLRGAVWDCYPLQLPDVEGAADMILLNGLIMGDSLARKTIPPMLRDELKVRNSDLADKLDKKDLKQLHQQLDWDEIPDDWFKDLMKDADVSYHALKRSCISVSLLQIELALERLYNENELGIRKEIVWAPPGNIPAWFDKIVSDEESAGFFSGTRAFFWAMSNKEILPYKAYLPLKKADLLQTDKRGKIIRYRYGHKIGSPYGELSRNLM